MKLSRIILASTIVISLGLAGCGATNTTATTPSQTEQKVSQATSSDIKPGVTKMLGIAADLKSAIDAGDEAKIKVTGLKFEDAWEPFEDSVKAKYPDLYKKVEQFLEPTIAGVQASRLDKQALGKLNGDLTQALNELAAKEQ